ncbi:MAG: BtpA/SgcQ family protein [Chloroflexota bacterium]
MAQNLFAKLSQKKTIIGMVHLGAMPGTPFYEEGSYEATFEQAVRDAKALDEGGATGCLVQTVERVYPTKDEADYARVVGVGNIVRAIAQETRPDFQIGVQIMTNALQASVAVAKVSGGSFLRCFALVGQSLSPWGMVEANPLPFLRYRKRINATNIKLIAEVDGMHFKWYGEKKPIATIARTAVRAGADAVEVAHADEETNLRQIHDIKSGLPDVCVILGGYTNHENAARRLAKADGAFVGSAFEPGGWGTSIDVQAVRDYMGIVSSL